MKTMLSSWNRRRKLKKIKHQLEVQVAASASCRGAVTSKEIKEFFETIRLTPTKHDLCRIGSNGDGGYLLANDLDGISACYSPGVSDEIDFDIELAQRGIAVHLADASVEPPEKMLPNMTFIKKFLGAKTEGKFITMEDWIAETNPGSEDLLLEMDIEGAEYAVLGETKESTLNRFRQIVIELHNFDKIFQRSNFEEIKSLLTRLQKNFVIIHLHHNNSLPIISSPVGPLSTVFEVTLLRRDRYVKNAQNPILPHKLDEPNVAKHPDEVIPNFYAVSQTDLF